MLYIINNVILEPLVMSLVFYIVAGRSGYLGALGDILENPGDPMEGGVAQVVPRARHPLALDAMVRLRLGVLHRLHF